MNSKLALNWVGGILILAIGLLHAYYASDELHETLYIEILFAGNFLLSVISTIGITLDSRFWGWELGRLIVLSSMIGYIISRTVGLPLVGMEEWGMPLANICFALEVLFVFVYLTKQSVQTRIRRLA